MSMLIFLLVLSVLIVVHEWGHFIMAKKLGVRVEQFALGFGPKIYARRQGDTEFRICAIPLGGYVKMAGDERAECKGAGYEYFSKSPGHRSLIVVMGPVINFVMAYVCFWLVFMIGFVDSEAMAKKMPAKVGQVLSGSPAAKAGLQLNDTVVRINDQVITNWEQMQDYILESKTPQLIMHVQRAGQDVAMTVTPQEIGQKDIFGREHKARRVGIAPVQIQSAKDVIIVRYGPLGAMKKAGEELWDVTAKTVSALYQMLIGLRSPKEAMGIIGIFFVIKFAASVGFSFLLHIVGIISASLAIFNLLPLIPLDGGHLLLLAIEKVRGRSLPPKLEEGIVRVGFSLILTLALFVFYVDFERVGWIDKITGLFNHKF